jgi:predicted lipid-binding transport protein (Tim44 family)
MRAVIGFLCLVLVLGTVALLAKQQLFLPRQQAAPGSGAAPAAANPAAIAADRAKAVQQEMEKAARENAKRLEELDK